MEEVLPELVTTSEETGLKSVQYGNIVAVVVEAIKDLIKKDESQDQKIENLIKVVEIQQQQIKELQKSIKK